MPNRQELIDQAMQLAVGVASDAQTSIIADAASTCELALPHAVREAAHRIAKMPGGLEDLAVTHTITLNGSGVGVLPDEVLKEYLDHSYLPDVQFAAFVPLADYNQFRFNGSGQMHYYSIKGSEFRYSATPPPANVRLYVPSVPAMPALVTDDILMSEKLAEQVILILAAIMRGELSLGESVET